MNSEKKEARKQRRADKKNFTVKGEQVVGQASLTYGRFGPLKARLLADLIRDKTVREAMQTLTFAVKPSTQPTMLRLLKAAMAAVDRDVYTDAQVNALVVGEVTVDDAAIIKRFRPRAMGRMNRIRKRTSHIILRLTDRYGIAEIDAAATDSQATEANA